MAITLPLPVRVAAGLVATGIKLVRSLPEEIPAIPVALVGNAMRLSMKVQQEITTLATRGDELLGGIIGGRAQENPSWATFDEDSGPARPVKASAARADTAAKKAPTTRSKASKPAPDTAAPSAAPQPAPTASGPVPSAEPAVTAPAADSAASAPTESTAPADDHPTRHTPEATALSDVDTTATEAAEAVSAAVVEAAMHAVDSDPAGEPEPDPEPVPAPIAAGPAPADDTATAQGPDTAHAPTEDADPTDDPAPGPGEASDAGSEHDEPAEPDGPAILPGYDGMTLAQVRGHLRELSAADVSWLLEYEQSGDNRAPFLTLLSNRLVTLGAQDS